MIFIFQRDREFDLHDSTYVAIARWLNTVFPRSVVFFKGRRVFWEKQNEICYAENFVPPFRDGRGNAV